MEAAKRPGAIINLGSASGLYPMYADPIYSGSKGLSFTSFGWIILFENFDVYSLFIVLFQNSVYSSTHEMLRISYGPPSCISSLCSLVKFIAYNEWHILASLCKL